MNKDQLSYHGLHFSLVLINIENLSRFSLICWLYIFIDDFYENYFHFYLTFPFLSQIFPQKFLTNNISLTIFQIYNLCIEEDYDPSHFHGRVEKFPFDDNHVPNFEMMKLFCESVHSWLSNDPKNIAAIHCMVLLASFFLLFVSLQSYVCFTWREIIQSSFFYTPDMPCVHDSNPRPQTSWGRRYHWAIWSLVTLASFDIWSPLVVLIH